MRLFIILSALLSVSIPTYANEFMDSIIGCYKTVSWNGHDVDQTLSSNISTIKKGESQLTLNLDYSVMPAYEISLYKQGRGFFASYSDAFPLISEGNYTSLIDGVIFDYSGELRYRPQPSYTGDITHQVQIRTFPSGELAVYIHTLIDSVLSVDQEDEFILAPTTCL